MENFSPMREKTFARFLSEAQEKYRKEELESRNMPTLAVKLAGISEQNKKRIIIYNQQHTWTSTMFDNYYQAITKAENAAKEGKREVYIDIQYSSENSTETQCVLKYLHAIDDFTVTIIKLRGTGIDPHIDFESTIKLEW
jgi:hypothetical protein